MPKFSRRLLPLLALGLAMACHPGPKADLLFIHARIWTGDSSLPEASALAIRDSTILWVGEDYQPYQGSNTQVVDLAGKMIVPGFIDNHTHFLQGAMQLTNVNLRVATSPRQFMDSLKAFAQRISAGRWILNGDWDHEAWGGQLPSRNWIDSLTQGHPVLVSRYDGHMALANSQALQLAGIDRNTPDPPGGQILRDPATGVPTGILRDEAMELVNKIIPEPSSEELQQIIETGQAHALAHGVTQIHDMGSMGGWTDLAAFRQAEAQGHLRIRIYSFVPISSWKKLDSLVKNYGRGDDWVHWGGLKGFVDGSLGSTTAWFYEPYLDAPHSTGLQVTDTTLLRQWILAADRAGLQVATHAIGDRANDWILDVYRQAQIENGLRDRRQRVEHAQHLRKGAIDRFVALGVIPSMQPYHAIDDGKWAFKRLDSDRLSRTYAFRSLLDRGAHLTFGSDWSVAPLDPIAGIYAAVTRRTLDGKNPEGWFPREKISVDDALRCYTVHNAYAGFVEAFSGKLKPGMRADLVILSQDLRRVAPAQIRSVQVEQTFVNGRSAFHK